MRRGFAGWRWAAALVIAVVGFVFATPAQTAGMLGVERLRCEYLDNPLGIDALRPRLSWIVSSDARGAEQTAYRIIVASSEAALARDEGDLWDSGRVESAETAQISYAGQPLASGMRAWWKVMAWDGKGEPSVWSAPAWWEAGLLEPEDWHGAWIARTEDPEARPAPMLRREFEVAGKIRRARLYVAGLGYHDLSINGGPIGGARMLEPGYTRYDRRVLYVTHDVTDALREGGNAIGVMLGNGWFNVQTKGVWMFHEAPWRQSPRLLAELRIELEDGRKLTVATDGQWKTSDGPVTFNSIYGGETYDARLEQPGWNSAGFNDGAWQPALTVAAPEGKLAAQSIPAIEATRELTPASVKTVKPGVQVFDIGQNLAGVAELKVSGPAGTTITMKYGERLTTEGLVDQAIIATHIWRMGRDQQFQTDTYTLKGEGEERWRARFVYHGFQYVQVEGAPEPLTADNLRAIFAHTAVKPAGKFESSNPLLNRIWENARWSYLSNLHGIPTDCPHREKNGWTGDAHLAVEFGLLNFDTLPLYEKWINDLGDEQRATGQLPGIVPTSGWGYAWGNGPAWDSAFLIIPETLRIFTGDTRSLDRHHAGHMRYVDYLTSQSKEGGIVDIGLGDYVPWKTETPEGVTSTGYYYQDLKIVAATARRLGREDDARLYEARAEAVREAFNAKYFDAASGLYAGGTQTALSGALHHGLVPAAEKERVAQRLAEAVLATDGHIDTGILGARYILEALTATGRADLAYAMAAKETQPGWGWWIGQGATTLWEIWNGGGSRNHIMLGDVAAWFVRSLAGIRPDPEAPGFRRVLIEPHPVEGLEWAKAEYDSVRGTIASGWRRENGRITLDVTIPANVTAEIRLPAVADVRESGRPLADADIWSINVYEGSTVIETGAGKYRFDWKE